MDSEKIKSLPAAAQVRKIVESNNLVASRIVELEKAGFPVFIRPMGSGGVLSAKAVGGELRYQISHGWGRSNYAYVVLLRS